MQLPEPAGDTVWQYTSAQGVLGILSPTDARNQANRMGLAHSELPKDGAFSIRFTDARYLNDPMELVFGAPILAEALKAAKDDLIDPSEEDGREIDDVIAWLCMIAENPSKICDHPSSTYVACFSFEKDSLSQWRGYAGQPGYAIGFDFNQLQRQLLPPITEEPKNNWEFDLYLRPLVQPVVYGEDAAREWYRRIAPDIVGPPIVYTAPSKPIPRQVLAEAALAGVKQQAYEVEKEVRAYILVGPTSVHREFRAGPQRSLGIIPYITASRIVSGGPHGLPALITEIMVGPGEDLELRQRAVEQVVSMEVGPGTIPVTTSGFRYRG